MGTPQIKNHTATLYKDMIYVFGGYDGKKNHSKLRVFNTQSNQWVKDQEVSGIAPLGRNGHTATLVGTFLYIIGGWLGQGPLAADDMHILDLHNLKWIEHNIKGNPPGACNMHTADCLDDRIYVFRGGDGKAYLNDLHVLDTTQQQWLEIEATGEQPPPRANHSSSIVGETLYIFGGWDGSKRLNDLYALNLTQMFWTKFKASDTDPAPRAGMSLCNVEDKLFLFGGSGPHAFCFNDLFVFDPVSSKWTECDQFKNPDCKPKARAGHSMTLCDKKIYIIGGSYGQEYNRDVYIIDTDPCPEWDFQFKGKKKLMKSLREFVNQEKFSDLTFIVEGRKFYAHRIVISLLR
jgi:N-acetylneuraminic acid mutarotase